MITDVLDDEGKQLAGELGSDATYCHLDVTSEDDWTAAVHHAVETFGGLHVLVNNAGINISRMMEDTPVEEFMRVFEVNTLGSWLGIKSVIEPMRAAGGGSIVNIVSVSVVAGLAGKTAYVGSKHAMRGISRAAAGELGIYNIRVNAILPGGVESEMTRGVIPPSQFADNPIPRIGQPEEIAKAALFLACADSSYCTGAEIASTAACRPPRWRPPNPSAPPGDVARTQAGGDDAMTIWLEDFATLPRTGRRRWVAHRRRVEEHGVGWADRPRQRDHR